MTVMFGALTRPAAGADVRARSGYRTLGLTLALIGLSFAAISLGNSIVAGGMARQGAADSQLAALAAWSFGLTTAAIATIKVAIAIVLLGIFRRIWLRVDSVKQALPHLVRTGGANAASPGELDPIFGDETSTDGAPRPLLIHRLAGLMWAPMLAMGVMLVYAGLLLSFAAAGNAAADPALASSQLAWVEGVQFLGEGLLLSGISFLLATILGAIRAGGGEVQESLGLRVRTLRMPTTAKLFVGLMMVGLIVEVAQFLGYAYIATAPGSTTFTTLSALLAPLREFGLGALLSGIVLALATIAGSLGFQFARITQIIATGR